MWLTCFLMPEVLVMRFDASQSKSSALSRFTVDTKSSMGIFSGNEFACAQDFGFSITAIFEVVDRGKSIR